MGQKSKYRSIRRYLVGKSQQDILRDLNKLKVSKIKLNRYLFETIDKEHLFAIKPLLELGANVNARDECWLTPLMWVSIKGNKNFAKLLMEQGTSINCKNNDGVTALMFAAYHKHKSIVELLLKHHAYVNIKDYYDNWTALDYCDFNYSDNVTKNIKKLLKKYGAKRGVMIK